MDITTPPANPPPRDWSKSPERGAGGQSREGGKGGGRGGKTGKLQRGSVSKGGGRSPVEAMRRGPMTKQAVIPDPAGGASPRGGGLEEVGEISEGGVDSSQIQGKIGDMGWEGDNEVRAKQTRGELSAWEGGGEGEGRGVVWAGEDGEEGDEDGLLGLPLMPYTPPSAQEDRNRGTEAGRGKMRRGGGARPGWGGRWCTVYGVR